MDQLFRALLILCSLSMIITPLVLAQDTDSPRVSETANESQPIEEIIVVGERTYYSLRLEIESAETEVFGLFNELNSNDEFDVTCTEEVFVGSHFKRRVCMADYLRKEQARNAGGSQTGLDDRGLGVGILLTLDGVKGEVRHKTLAMEAEMLKLAQENNSFAEAILKLTELVGLIQAKKAENPFFFD